MGWFDGLGFFLLFFLVNGSDRVGSYGLFYALGRGVVWGLNFEIESELGCRVTFTNRSGFGGAVQDRGLVVVMRRCVTVSFFTLQIGVGVALVASCKIKIEGCQRGCGGMPWGSEGGGSWGFLL